MAAESISRFNLVDVIIILLIGWICYISVRNGFTSEIFKLLGAISATYLSLHYFTGTADYLRAQFDLRIVPLAFLDFICAFLLAALGYAIFIILRQVFNHFIKMEAISALNKWGGLVLGIFRSVLLSGLVVFMMFISSVQYLRGISSSSFLGSRMLDVAPSTYEWLWANIGSKFAPGEKFNKTIYEIREGYQKL